MSNNKNIMKQLLKNLYFQKDKPNSIPYVTSYYKKKWGFCISYNRYKELDKIYSVKDKFKVGDQEYTLKDAIELAGLQLEDFYSEEEQMYDNQIDRMKNLAFYQ